MLLCWHAKKQKINKNAKKVFTNEKKYGKIIPVPEGKYFFIVLGG